MQKENTFAIIDGITYYLEPGHPKRDFGSGMPYDLNKAAIVLEAAEDGTGVTMEYIKKNERRYGMQRIAACLLMKQYVTGLTVKELGKLLNYSEHSPVCHAIPAALNMLEINYRPFVKLYTNAENLVKIALLKNSYTIEKASISRTGTRPKSVVKFNIQEVPAPNKTHTV